MGKKLIASVLITALLASSVLSTVAFAEDEPPPQENIIEETTAPPEGEASGISPEIIIEEAEAPDNNKGEGEENSLNNNSSEEPAQEDNSGNNEPDVPGDGTEEPVLPQSENTEPEQNEQGNAEDPEAITPAADPEVKEFYYVEYVTAPDPKYGKPSDEVLPDIEAYRNKQDELIVIELKPDLSSTQTEVTIVNEAGEEETFTGTWTFSGWICDTQDIDWEFRTLPVTEDTIIYGSWTFTPDETPAEQPVVITVPDELPSYEWATGVVDLSVMYSLGYLDQATVEAALWNMENVPVHQLRFISVEIKQDERTGLVDAAEAVAGDIRDGSRDLSGAEEPDTCMIISAADRAGLLSGSTKFFIDANREDLYSWMTGSAYCETGTLEEVGSDPRFARPGNLFFWKDDDNNNIVKVGIVTEVNGKYITVQTAGDHGQIQNYVTFAEDVENSGELLIPRCNDTGRIIFDYLVNDMGFNKAISTGVLANMYAESALNTRSWGDGGTSIGLCQWHSGRCARLIEFCLNNGYNICSLEGQLEYFKFELNNNYSSVVNWFGQLQDCRVAAETAGMGMCRWFEMPAEVDARCAERSSMAGYMYGIYGNICCEDALPAPADTEVPAEPETEPEIIGEPEPATEPAAELERPLLKPVPVQEAIEAQPETGTPASEPAALPPEQAEEPEDEQEEESHICVGYMTRLY